MTPDDASSDAAPADPAPGPDAAPAPGPAAVPATTGEPVALTLDPGLSSTSQGPPAGPEPASVMSLVGHLTELRNRIIWSIAAVLVGAVVGYVLGQPIIAALSSPLPGGKLQFPSIGDPFAIRVEIALVVGVILAMPVILWHIWRFVAPGLTASERRAILPWIPAALIFFVLGVGIAYIVLPYAVAFLLSFQTEQLQPILFARDYFNFVTTLFLAFGLLMEFPILLVGLSRVGIVTSQRLSRSRRVIILGIAIFSAVATPGGDLVSPTVLGVTLYLLFEGTIIVIRRSGR